MSRIGDAQVLSNVAAGTYGFSLLGGRYSLAYAGTGAGTVDLKMVMPDGSSVKAVATQIAAVTGFQTGLELPPGQYQIIISGFTANYVAVQSIPN